MELTLIGIHEIVTPENQKRAQLLQLVLVNQMIKVMQGGEIAGVAKVKLKKQYKNLRLFVRGQTHLLSVPSFSGVLPDYSFFVTALTVK